MGHSVVIVAAYRAGEGPATTTPHFVARDSHGASANSRVRLHFIG